MNFVVIHLEKTGGTTIEKSIQKYLDKSDIYLYDWNHMIFNGVMISEHSAAAVVKEFCSESWPSFRKLSTVRNPIKLVASMYNYARFIVENTPSNEPLLEGAPSAYVYSKMTNRGVKGFVDYMIKEDFPMMSPQTTRLQEMLNDGMIIDLEDLNDKWNQAMHYIGLSGAKMNAHNVLGSSHIDIDSTTRGMIRNHFESDYDVLPKITGRQWN